MSHLFLLLAQSAESAPFLAPESSGIDFTWLFVKVILAMLLVCGAAFAVIKYVLPRAHFVKRQTDSEIEILERFTLEPRKNLYILKIADKKVVLGSTENALSTLLELEYKEPPHASQEK